MILLISSRAFIKQQGLIYKGEPPMREKVETALNKIRPSLEADGGNVELISVKDGVVTVKLTGACAGCPMSTLTLQNGIERIVVRRTKHFRPKALL